MKKGKLAKTISLLAALIISAAAFVKIRKGRHN